MQVKIIITEADKQEILRGAAKEIAFDCAEWLFEKSENGFYEDLSDTIKAEDTQVVASGLCVYIMNKRKLTEEFIAGLE